MDLHELSHWTCVLAGLLLVVTALASRLTPHTVGAPGPWLRGMPLRRATLVLVGLFGILYGAYWLSH